MTDLPKNKKVVFYLLGVLALMGAGTAASVPFYSWFCKVTGYAGTTTTAEVAPPKDQILDQTMIVRFDGSVEKGMKWEFKPAQFEMTLRIGEVGLAFFEAYNPTDHVIAGQAGYNVAPYSAGNFFNKIDCFCFTEQVLQPHERVMMPVTFYIDPAIVNDREGKFVHSVTLSYTFYEIPVPEDQKSASLNTSNDQAQVN
jgi:cytochrome c oxidase assembly protein subunit 11